jgi:hypothetical protein
MRLTNSLLAYLLILVVVGSISSSPVSGQTYQTSSFSLGGTSLVSCWYSGVRFDATQGQRFSVKWNETETDSIPNSLDLYIVAPSAIREIWFCDTGPVWLYSNSGAFGLANWAAPSAGEYIVLLVNNNYSPVSGTLSVMAVNATVTATSIGYATARQPPPCLGNDCSRA